MKLEDTLTDSDKTLYESLFDDALDRQEEQDLSAAIQEIQQLIERYKYLGEVDEGGIKKIHLYEDCLTGRKVARGELKIPSAEKQDQFINEVKITASLEHPNIMPVYDMGLNENNEPYFIMKLIEGDNLAQIIEKLRSLNADCLKIYPLDKRLEIFLKICDAISYAHSKGVVHLDLKPANIQIGKFGEVTVCDWGLARDLQQFEDSGELKVGRLRQKLTGYTQDGLIKGTPGYMAPEQVDSKYGTKSEKTDVFSLGSLLYTLFTTKSAYKSTNLHEILEDTVHGRIIDPLEENPGMPISLRAVILKAMSVEQEKRYKNVGQLSDDLRAYLRGFATKAEEAGLWSLFKLLLKRHSKLVTLLSLFVLVFIGQFTVSYNRIQQEKDLAEEQRDKASQAADLAVQARQKAETSEQQKSILVDELLNEKQKTENSRIKIAGLMFHQALKFRNLGEYKKAFRMTLDANQLDPGNEQMELFLAGLYLGEWQFEKSLALYKKYDFEAKEFIMQKLENLLTYKGGELPVSEVLDMIELFENTKIRLPKASLTSHFMQSASEYLSFEKRSALAESYFLKRLKKNPLNALNEKETQFSLDFAGAQHLPNLNILYKFPIYEADFSNSVIKSLREIKTWPLVKLNLNYTVVIPEYYLKDLKLKELYLRGTKIKGLTKINEKYLEIIDLPEVFNRLELFENYPKLKKVIVPQAVYNKKYIENLGLKASVVYR